MSFADRTEKLVPYLRRYARAVTGDTRTGDACVEAVLETVLTLSLESDFEASQYDREGLYRLLDQELNQLSDSDAARARRALLLVSVERLPAVMACRILGVRANVLTEMLELAERDFAQMTATRMLIIEDEPLIAAQLKRIAQSLGHTVVGIAMTANDAVSLGREHEPDIILCDIHLQGGSLGTDAIAELKLPDDIPVVYITAYPEQYLSTTNQGPSYLITKPFDPDYLKAVIGHALINVQSA
ncbi:MAG: response regulator [Pseudomonadota bacterium]